MEMNNGKGKVVIYYRMGSDIDSEQSHQYAKKQENDVVKVIAKVEKEIATERNSIQAICRLRLTQNHA